MHLSDTAMGMIFSAFALGYALAQIPSGWLADRVGPRLALALVTGVWSALTSLPGAAGNLTSLLTIRFLFGVREAGAVPACSTALSHCGSPAGLGPRLRRSVSAVPARAD